MDSSGYGPTPPEGPGGSYEKPRKGVYRWVALGCGVAFLLSVVLGVVAVAMCARAARSAFVDDPVKAEQVAREMIDFEIPGGSKGVFAMDMVYRMAVVSDLADPPKIALVVATVPATGSGMSREDLERQMRQSMDQQMKQQSISLVETQTKEYALCDHPVQVVVQRGTVQRPEGAVDMAIWQTTVVRDEDIMVLHVNAAGPDADATAQQVFDSVRCK